VAGAGDEKIVVFGASGRSGRYIIRELAADGRTFVGVTSNSARARENVPGDYEWVEADVRDPAAVAAALRGATAVISALGATQFKGPNGPEFVDWEGVRNVVDAAKAAGVAQMVLISASGVTNPDHPLNKMGNVMTWKLKGEDYLRASGVPYTVIRPGGLTDTEPYQHAIVFRQGDNLPYGTKLSVTSRGDVARMCIAAIDDPAARNKTLEAFTDASLPYSTAWADGFAGLLSD
jgi:uncharacterized protein YbjT (DUF2867 family)